MRQLVSMFWDATERWERCGMMGSKPHGYRHEEPRIAMSGISGDLGPEELPFQVRLWGGTMERRRSKLGRSAHARGLALTSQATRRARHSDLNTSYEAGSFGRPVAFERGERSRRTLPWGLPIYSDGHDHLMPVVAAECGR